MDERGYLLIINAIREAAQVLLQSRLGPTGSVGVNWANRFMQRRSTLRSQYARNIDR
jgi:hypothetical protein